MCRCVRIPHAAELQLRLEVELVLRAEGVCDAPSPVWEVRRRAHLRSELGQAADPLAAVMPHGSGGRLRERPEARVGGWEEGPHLGGPGLAQEGLCLAVRGREPRAQPVSQGACAAAGSPAGSPRRGAVGRSVHRTAVGRARGGPSASHGDRGRAVARALYLCRAKPRGDGQPIGKGYRQYARCPPRHLHSRKLQFFENL